MTELQKLIEEYNIPVTQINPYRNYWLVRTQGGDYYDEFFHDNFIAINWDAFDNLEQFAQTEKALMLNEIERRYPKEQPGRIYGQIFRFLFEINNGDIVMIPSKNSTHISFGIVKSETFIHEITESALDENVCPFKKRRNVEWVKTVKRAELDPYLYRMMQSHHTINNANDYADVIDRTLHSFYVKNGKAHLVLKVKQDDEIAAVDLLEALNNFLDIIPYVKDPMNEEKTYSKEVVDLKLRVQSPGIIEFISQVAPWAVLGMGLALNYIVGGKIKGTFTKERQEVEASSDGMLEKLLKIKQHSDKHELKRIEEANKHSIEKLKIETPGENKKTSNE
ncbi:restriction endonuclease [Evansella clarkii]|uniref:restriction endonuclease n=1 Tax=Evansella clarkii TaxID=79879 RepID=UPI000B44E6D1|nr:hypothetical protein [Evansella clarkii]